MENHWTSGWRNYPALMVMTSSDSKSKEADNRAVKNALTNDLRNIARIYGIKWINVSDGTRKIVNFTYQRITKNLCF